MKAFGDGFVEEFFLLDGSSFAHGDLDHHQLVRAADVQVTGVKDEMLLIVFGEYLEIIVLSAQSSSPIRMAAPRTVVQRPRLSPTADCVTFMVRTILLEMR